MNDPQHVYTSGGQRLRAVVFDRDQTLVHFDPLALGAIEAEIAAIAPTLPPRASTAHWTAWPGPWPRTAAEEPQFWAEFWGDFARRYTLDDLCQTQLVAVGSRYHTCFRAFDDAQACLRALRSHGLQLAVLTNFDLPSIDRTLDHAGIDPEQFAVLLSSTTTGAPKPHRVAFEAVLAALDLPAAACAFVDDLPVHVEGARLVGIRALLLDRGDQYPTWPGERITSLRQLPAALGFADGDAVRYSNEQHG